MHTIVWDSVRKKPREMVLKRRVPFKGFQYLYGRAAFPVTNPSPYSKAYYYSPSPAAPRLQWVVLKRKIKKNLPAIILLPKKIFVISTHF